MSLAFLARTMGPPAEWTPPPAKPAEDACARILAGRLGDAGAIAGYVRRANRMAGASLLCAAPLAMIALMVHPGVWVAVTVLVFGSLCDWQRGRLACGVRVERGRVVIESGPWSGLILARSDVEAIGFGAAARRCGGKPPETFWSGDFRPIARSHLVLLRFTPGRNTPRRLLIPETGFAEAQAAQRRLLRWHSGR